jgi:hypothetical protein
MVVVHRGDTDHGRRIDGEDVWGLVESVVAARRSEAEPRPDLRPLEATALSSQLPRASMPEYRALPASDLNDCVGDYEPAPGATELGDYELTPEATVLVFLFDEKPYIHMPGIGAVQMSPPLETRSLSESCRAC